MTDTNNERITAAEWLTLAGWLIGSALLCVAVALPLAYALYPLFMPIFN